nr:uncharacterized protein LOC111429088 isoform X1 [Onthophagus taurus]
MLISGTLVHLCSILYLNILFIGNDVSAILTDKPQPHSNYIKEMFPFLQKGDKNEDMSALLAEVKREKRVSHHGNFKRTPHVVHFNPAYAQNRRFIRRPFVGINRFLKNRNRIGKRNVLSGNNARQIFLNRKFRDVKGNRVKRAKMSKSSTKNNIEPSKTTATSLTKSKTNSFVQNSFNSTKKIQKRTDIKKKYVNPKKRESDIKNVNAKEEILDPSAFDDITEKSLAPHKAVRSISSTPKELNQGEDDPSNEFIIRVSDDTEFIDNVKELAKREIKPEHKHKKNIKSVITKILIIPVERQFEEAGDDTPEEINMVSLKHAKTNNKKKLSTKSHKSSSITISETAKPITTSLVPMDTLNVLESAQPESYNIVSISEPITEPPTNLDVTVPSTIATIKPTGSKPRKLIIKKKFSTKPSLKSLTRNFNLLLTNMPTMNENSVTNVDKMPATSILDPS